ncbi:pendrin [Lampris incognitus]|uniref:pendrin n=1 Tax=Lampris incognitus TaxID=2546036 RepID=UPI0024B54F8E|nr:pendrin [Lampris incognitus]
MDSFLPENQYRVSRAIYSNTTFEDDHERQTREEKTVMERLKHKCGSCSGRQTLEMLNGVFPVIDWLSRYPVREWLPSDVISGISTGLVCSLQGMAYALLVSVAPIYGLYSAFFPILTYFLLGTSRHISVGPFPVTCQMVGSVVLTLVPENHFLPAVNKTMDVNGTAAGGLKVDTVAMETQRIMVASTMTVLAGIFQVLMGLLHVGFLVRYLSDPLVGGFTTAAAFHVLVSQLKIVLSVPTSNHNGLFSVFYTLIDVFTNIRQTNMADLVAGVVTVVIVMVVKEINTKFQHRIPVPIPIEVIVTVAAVGISYAMDLESCYGASIVRTIPRGFVAPRPPNTSLWFDILSSSFSTAVVGYAVAISVAKVYAAKHDYIINGNQELIAFGFSNVFCGCFSSFMASTALSRTAVQESTGGKSQVAGVVSALMVMIVILALGNLLEPLQKSVLAAIVIANLKGMFLQVAQVPQLWTHNRADCFIWLATCLASVVLGLDIGLLAGLVFEMGTVVVRTQFPTCSTLGNVPGTNIYRNLKDYRHISEIPGVKIFKCNSPIYFANTDYFKEQLTAAVGFDAVKVFKKRCKALKKIYKLIKKRQLKVTETGAVISEVDLGMENKAFEKERDLGQSGYGDWASPEVAVHVDWASELPVKVTVPKVHIQSLVLDFSAVSFLDVVAVKCLRLIIKEFLRIGVNVYIASCDDEIVLKMEALAFFDETVTRDILFVSVHDAILFINLETAKVNTGGASVERLSVLPDSKETPPFVEEEDLIETYDNQQGAIHGLSN